jgi:hypothetical protein
LDRQWLVGLGAGDSQIENPFGDEEVRDQWLPNNTAARDSWLTVPRDEVVSNTTVRFCRFAGDYCVSPSFAPSAGGIMVHVAAREFGCLEDLQLGCMFGVVSMPAVWNETSGMLDCEAPDGTANSTVVFRLVDLASGRRIESHRSLFFSYLPDNDVRVSGAALEFLQSANATCEECAAFNPDFCVKDCEGSWRGSAVVDECGVCSGGLSGLPFNGDMDCEGICFGPFSVSASNQCEMFESDCCESLQSWSCEVGHGRYLVFPSSATFDMPEYIDWIKLSFPSDHSRLQEIRLQFTFPYYDFPRRRVFLSSDGAILFNS